MSNRVKVLIIAAIVLFVALTVGPWTYINVWNDESPAGFTDVDSRFAEPSALGDDLTGTWNVSRESQVGYRVEEILFGQNTTAVGRTSGVTGSAVLDGLTLSSAEFTADMASVTSDSERRDSQFYGRILETSRFPDGVFKLTAPATLDRAPGVNALPVPVTGELTLHGVTKSVQTEIEVKATGTTVNIAGSIPIAFADYDIDNPSFGGVTTEDNGILEFSINLTR